MLNTIKKTKVALQILGFWYQNTSKMWFYCVGQRNTTNR